jgi:hypothetical protein
VASSEVFEKIARFSREAAVSLNVRSAVNPCLWLCAVISVPALVGACFTSGVIQDALLVFAAIPLVIFAVGYIYFMITDPDKLQSERYQLQKRALEMIHEKGGSIPISPASIQAITNPGEEKLLSEDFSN